MSKNEVINWVENDASKTTRWHSESGVNPPRRVIVADDSLTADAAYRMASEGVAMLWRGDFQNARQLLQAMDRRIARGPGTAKKRLSAFPEAFRLHRQLQALRARVLNMLLIPVDDDYRIALRRAPDVTAAFNAIYGPSQGPFAISLRELQGVIGGHQWQVKGVWIDALQDHIFPHYGVFSPVRGEYVQLVAEMALPQTDLAFDVGTGTGVLAAVLARRGIKKVIATDVDARALRCAKENINRLDLAAQVDVEPADLFPAGRAGLILCNPPWIPARPSSPVERAIYDPENAMLLGFLNGLAAHLAPGGEGWLIISDIAEHLGLRSREMLLAVIAQAGLAVAGKRDIQPRHAKVRDASDPLHRARSAEITSLWRLVAI